MDRMSSRTRIAFAQDFFRFAYRIGTPISYGLKLDIPTPPAGIIFGRHLFSAQDLEISDDNFALCGTLLERLAYRLLAIELNSALENKFGPNRGAHKDDFVRNSCTVVRLIRNAVAHDILEPVWEIPPSLKYTVFLIDGVLEFDTNGPDGTGLDGKLLKRLDFGGPIALFRLSEKLIPLL